MLRGRRAVHRHWADATRAGLVGHQPCVELAGFARGESEQQVELTLGDGLRSIDALVADDEMTLIGRSSDESPLIRELVEKTFRQRTGALPGRRTGVLEHHPARALLDAGCDE